MNYSVFIVEGSFKWYIIIKIVKFFFLSNPQSPNFSHSLSLRTVSTISPPNTTLRSQELGKWSPIQEILDSSTDSPCKLFRKCIENRMKNIHKNYLHGGKWVWQLKVKENPDSTSHSCLSVVSLSLHQFLYPNITKSQISFTFEIPPMPIPYHSDLNSLHVSFPPLWQKKIQWMQKVVMIKMGCGQLRWKGLYTFLNNFWT